jgi:hypothetical protein
MEGFPKKLLCINDKDQFDPQAPHVQIGNEYTGLELRRALDPHFKYQYFYTLAEFPMPDYLGYYFCYAVELFTEMETELDEMELVNQKEEYA